MELTDRLDHKEDMETPGYGDHLQLKGRVAPWVNVQLIGAVAIR